jgi:hypothetical protein
MRLLLLSLLLVASSAFFTREYLQDALTELQNVNFFDDSNPINQLTLKDFLVLAEKNVPEFSVESNSDGSTEVAADSSSSSQYISQRTMSAVSKAAKSVAHVNSLAAAPVSLPDMGNMHKGLDGGCSNQLCSMMEYLVVRLYLFLFFLFFLSKYFFPLSF